MKKIITLCILSMLMSAASIQAGKYNTVNMNTSPSASYSVWVKIILNFHRPKMQCKSGFGICIDFEFGTDKATGYGAALCPAQARINSAGQLELKVAESDLQKYENGFALPYFQKGSLFFEEPYTFSDPVTKLLGASHQLTIGAGSYAVVFDAATRTYTVTFPG
ncbi:MAG: hypothetical protein NTU51_00860 [Bacteroidetes bacterium]|nr:hypothetical protein [Bacteroidota bacterium]